MLLTFKNYRYISTLYYSILIIIKFHPLFSYHHAPITSSYHDCAHAIHHSIHDDCVI